MSTTIGKFIQKIRNFDGAAKRMASRPQPKIIF